MDKKKFQEIGKSVLNGLQQSAGKMRQAVSKTPTKEDSAESVRERTGKGRRNQKIKFWVETVLLVAVMTTVMFSIIFLIYVNHDIKGHAEVDMSEFDMSVSTELYHQDPDSGEWVMYQTLYAGENRRLVTADEISDYLRQAAVAIEDKRFEKHHGVDWRGTVRAVFSTLIGGHTEGGSTITQQMIKNVTGDKQETVKRKVTEIYRALELEKRYSKDEILNFYLNAIYLGNSCYGVETASDMYFDKHAADLTLAESASLIAITNNPSRYDPLISDWTREQNRGRQLDVLKAMLDQKMIDKETYEAAVAEEVVFTDGYTNLGNYVGEQENKLTEEKKSVNKANNSYFTDQVIEDVAKALVELKGIKDDPDDMEGGRSAMEKAASLVYGGGYKIYTTENPKYQAIAEDVFEHTDYVELTDSNGAPLQAAITLMDPYTGHVLALVGGTGTKEVDRGWNWATSERQCGSAIKPISTYAPALDDGTISAASSIDDYPVEMDGSPYPQNDNGRYNGMTTVQKALVNSVNTCAVRTNLAYGTTRSYNFMTEELGFTTLTETDSEQVGNMALGGLTHGVTTEEMAAAYSVFVNDGVYTSPCTFLKVEDSEGNVILETKQESHEAIQATTAYLMRDMLSDVISDGTGGSAWFDDMSMGGKTGTTDEERDRYFVGFTPYYCAAVWCGYKSNEIIEAGANPSAVLWREVMSRIHEGLSDPGFHSCTGLTTVSVCMDSGLLATDACSHDIRGSRVRTVTVAADNVPGESCDLHKMVSYCKDGKHIATENCPASSVSQVAVLDLDRELLDGVTATDTPYTLAELEKGGVCPAHKTGSPIKKIVDAITDGGSGEDGDTDTPQPEENRNLLEELFH